MRTIRGACSIVREIVAPGAANCETSRSILQLFVGSAVCISARGPGAGAFNASFDAAFNSSRNSSDDWVHDGLRCAGRCGGDMQGGDEWGCSRGADPGYYAPGDAVRHCGGGEVSCWGGSVFSGRCGVRRCGGPDGGEREEGDHCEVATGAVLRVAG